MLYINITDIINSIHTHMYIYRERDATTGEKHLELFVSIHGLMFMSI